MFSAFVGGFMGFMGMYAAYRVVKSGIVQALGEGAKGGWEEARAEEKAKEQNHRGNRYEV